MLAVIGLLCLFEMKSVARGADAFPYDLPFDTAHDELLEGGRAVCVRLGLDPAVPGRCNSVAALAASGQQTDRSLWFSKTTGPGAAANCIGAVAFERHRAGGGVTYLCRAPDEDVVITPDELANFVAEIARLNALPRKTLAEHDRALAIQSDIDCVTGRQSTGCD